MAKSLEVALQNYPEEILNEIKELESSVVGLIEPPFRVSEIFAVVENAGDILAKSEGVTKPEVKQALNDIWAYFNDKYKIIEKLDEAIKLPAIVEPFDGMLIGLLVTQVAIPSIVGLLKLPE